MQTFWCKKVVQKMEKFGVKNWCKKWKKFWGKKYSQNIL